MPAAESADLAFHTALLVRAVLPRRQKNESNP